MLGVMEGSEGAGGQWVGSEGAGTSTLLEDPGVLDGPGGAGCPGGALEHPVVREGWGLCWGAAVPRGAEGPWGQLAPAQLICSSSQVEVGMAL